MNLTRLQQQIEQLSTEHRIESERHKRTIARINETMYELIKMRDRMFDDTLDICKVDRGSDLIEADIPASVWHTPEVQSMVAAAVADIARGTFEIRKHSFAVAGTKLRLRRADRPYGSVSFENDLIAEIGLTPAAHRTQFTPEDIEAMIYYLVRYLY